MDILLEFIKNLLDHPAPANKIKQLADLIEDTFQLMPSAKHMVGNDSGRLESTPSLNQRAFG